MPHGYFIPEYALTRDLLPAPMKRIDGESIMTSLQEPITRPKFRESVNHEHLTSTQEQTQAKRG